MNSNRLPSVLFLCFALFSLLLAGCGVKDPKNEKFIVASGDGVKVTRGELNAAEMEFLKQRGWNMAQVPPDKVGEFEKSIAERLTLEKLIMKAGSDVKIANLDDRAKAEVQNIRSQFPDEKSFLDRLAKVGVTPEKVAEDIKKKITLQEIVRAKVPVGAEPKDEEIQKFFHSNEGRFLEPAKVKASHVLVRVTEKNTTAEKATLKKKAEAARARISKGEDFAKVAAEVSDDASNAKTGGVLDYFQKGEMVPEFEKVAFGSKIGVLSPVFETPFGYHFLKVTDSQPEKKHTYEEVRGQISTYLQERSRGEAMTAFTEKLTKDAKVVYHLPETAPVKPAPAPTVSTTPPVSVPPPPPAPAPAPAPAPPKP
jgi:parvulin-like peptidyl-prolyl isomerase